MLIGTVLSIVRLQPILCDCVLILHSELLDFIIWGIISYCVYHAAPNRLFGKCPGCLLDPNSVHSPTSAG